VRSLVDDAARDAANGGGGVMPRWVAGPRETGVMETGNATPWVASAYAFGATGFDTAAAWTAMQRVETIDGLMDQYTIEHYRLADFLAKGYVPYYDDYQGEQSASFTLEYCIGDFALAQFAGALGRADDHDHFLALSHQWANLFDDASGYIQPRMPDGTWRAGFTPSVGHFQGFVEGSPAQYTWMIPHDWDALFARMGGNDAVVARLDTYFTKLNDAYDTWATIYHCAGNEPGFFTPWAYAAAGAPAKTQAVVRRILTELFEAAEPGADDLGAMSAWYVWAALGMYPVLPGTDVLALHGPRFPGIVVRYADGTRTLAITGAGAAVDAPYVADASLDGAPLSGHRVTLGALTAADPGSLAFTMGTAASAWAAGP
jgi:predicted alpha-1,2-mannosidase